MVLSAGASEQKSCEQYRKHFTMVRWAYVRNYSWHCVGWEKTPLLRFSVSTVSVTSNLIKLSSHRFSPLWNPMVVDSSSNTEYGCHIFFSTIGISMLACRVGGGQGPWHGCWFSGPNQTMATIKRRVLCGTTSNLLAWFRHKIRWNELTSHKCCCKAIRHSIVLIEVRQKS